MACDFVEEHSENIANLIEKPRVECVKSPRYRSIHSTRARLELARSKSAHRTLGLAHHQAVDPRDFLRKRSGLERRQRSAPGGTRHVHYRPPDYERQLPKWRPAPRPRPSTALPDLPRDPARRGQNFPRRNVERAKGLRPKPVKPRFVDTRRGDAHDLMASGLKPVFIYKEGFGKVPERRKKRLAKEDCSDKRLEGKQSLCRYVTEDEREKLLRKLKVKWEETMKVFQCLPFLIDTVTKIKRKSLLEEKLRQLERDIEMIENHPYIYVYDDDNE